MNDENIKFITFSGQFNDAQGQELRNFINNVNDFMNKHKILDVKIENNQQSANTIYFAGIMNYLTYIIKYEDL